MPQSTTEPKLATIYSKESEMALLGAVIINPKIFGEIDVQASDFYIHANAIIWRAIDAILEANGMPDYVALAEYLERTDKLKEIGGDPYLTSIVFGAYSSLNYEYHASVVREKARRRSLLQVANNIVKAAYDEGSQLEATIPAFVNALVDTARVSDGARPMSEYLTTLFHEAEERYNTPSDTWGIGTGFSSFDRITGGLQQSELMILSGVPGVGKSMLAMQMAAQMGRAAPGAIYSIEMSGKAVARRLISGMGSIDTRAIKTGKLDDSQWGSFVKAVDTLSQLPIFMSDGSNWTTTSLRADLSRLKAQHGIKWFVLDYLYLLNDGVGSDEIERTSLASKGLKRAARELDLAGIAVHSMNKAGMNETADIPSQGQLRGSGQVVYDADLITFLTPYSRKLDKDMPQVSPQDEDKVKVLWFGKGRELEDPRKYIKLVRRSGYPEFAEYAPEGAK